MYRIDKRLTTEYILLTCSDFTEIRESHFTAQSLRVLFQEISSLFFLLLRFFLLSEKYQYI